MSERNPQARDRMRGTRLRAIRTERCKLPLERAAEMAGWHGSKLSRTERGLRPVTIEEFATLITAWGLPAKDRDQVLAEIAAGSTSGWWDRPIPGVPEDVGTLAGYEAEANELVTVAMVAVPGLLQTYETAISIMAADGVPSEDIETRWMARLRRQQIITKVDYTAYLTEAALRTPWGGQEAWRNQLAHLLRSQQIGIGVRVIPGLQTDVLLLNTWHWMRFPHTPPVVHVELASGAAYIHEADRYTTMLSRLDRIALPKDGSRKLISELMEG
ncbi:MAG TPA: helix-turn-helix transcriptional regulator [Actinophytocola sp.]|uniref:helix-turn-helix domain-containing protein n=1 Tax=Actinophytocola sp. TaxID=1872138 RepID=UPI002DB9F204|nr:helix-turn-helix transcriptional regulator [Actinophytocola sp.]HEU5472582.1 helix-turn-helix transcriptional regulator [Actinophytocola sp.]